MANKMTFDELVYVCVSEGPERAPNRVIESFWLERCLKVTQPLKAEVVLNFETYFSLLQKRGHLGFC